MCIFEPSRYKTTSKFGQGTEAIDSIFQYMTMTLGQSRRKPFLGRKAKIKEQDLGEGFGMKVRSRSRRADMRSFKFASLGTGLVSILASKDAGPFRCCLGRSSPSFELCESLASLGLPSSIKVDRKISHHGATKKPGVVENMLDRSSFLVQNRLFRSAPAVRSLGPIAGILPGRGAVRRDGAGRREVGAGLVIKAKIDINATRGHHRVRGE